MTTRERIEADYIREFKAKNAQAVEGLRNLRAALKTAEIDKMKPLEEADVVDIVGKEVKKLKDAADQFTAGGREDLAEKNRAEIALFEGYLPAQLTEEELSAIVSAAVAGHEGATAKDFGSIMKKVMEEAKGRTDGGKVSAAVKAALADK